MFNVSVLNLVEVNLLWSQHQAHHGSENYTAATALRIAIPNDWVHLIHIFTVVKFNSIDSFLHTVDLYSLFSGGTSSALFGAQSIQLDLSVLDSYDIG